MIGYRELMLAQAESLAAHPLGAADALAAAGVNVADAYRLGRAIALAIDESGVDHEESLPAAFVVGLTLGLRLRDREAAGGRQP